MADSGAETRARVLLYTRALKPAGAHQHHGAHAGGRGAATTFSLRVDNGTHGVSSAFLRPLLSERLHPPSSLAWLTTVAGHAAPRRRVTCGCRGLADDHPLAFGEAAYAISQHTLGPEKV